MTAPEMKNEFLIELDRVAALDAPSYTDREISDLLTRSQERLIKRRYNPYGNKYQEGFEQTEKRRKELRKLVKGPYDSSGTPLAQKSSDQTTALNNGEIFDLPDDLWLTVQESAIVTSSDDCSDLTRDIDNDGTEEKLKYASVSPITHDEINSNWNNPFRKPTDTRVWRLDHSAEVNNTLYNIHELVTNDDYTVVDYLIRYIRYPRPIIVGPLSDPLFGLSTQTDPELDDTFHREIVSEAVTFAVHTTKPNEYKLSATEGSKTE